jgi:hypothetical protein
MSSDDLTIGNPLPKAPAAGPSDFTSEPGEPSIAIPEVSIDADEVAPEVSPCPTASAVLDDDVGAVSDDSGAVAVDDDVADDTTDCSPPGAVAVLNCDAVTVLNCDAVAVLNCDTVWAPVPAAWVTEASAPAAPDGSVVVGCGAVKGSMADAAEDAPA